MSDQAIDPRLFRKTMGLFATGVTVIAVEAEGEFHAMTANAVTSLSLDPLLVLVCVDKRAHTASLLEKSQGFSINILSEHQAAIADVYAKRWKHEPPPPHQFVPWVGGPRLEDCIGALGCQIHERIEGGDHWIVIGRVVALHRAEEVHRPLLYYHGNFGHFHLAEEE